MSDGKPTTYEVFNPKASSEPTATGEEPSKTTNAFSRTGDAVPPSTVFPTCNSEDAKPFCLPLNGSDLYVGKTYYATWNPAFFPKNSTVTIKVHWANDSGVEAWSSPPTENSWGFVPVEVTKEWLQGYDLYDLSFTALNFEGSDPSKNAEAFDGPNIVATNEPARHYPPPPPTKFNKEGLIIGLPVALAFVALVLVGLWYGMRKHRTIGLGNIMGRRNRGYGVGKSRRQRLGLGKKGAIRLEERDARPADSMPQYHDNHRGHTRGDSLGSLVSDDDNGPTQRGNHFRDEIQRQRTGR